MYFRRPGWLFAKQSILALALLVYAVRGQEQASAKPQVATEKPLAVAIEDIDRPERLQPAKETAPERPKLARDAVAIRTDRPEQTTRPERPEG
ncbi:MAG TPA: hypothetical protein VGP72_25855 [Planctomycetota bacterium]